MSLKRTAYLGVKRLLDIVASTSALAALSPVLGAISLAIRVDSSGPALFRQERVGKNGRLYTVFKFRTMNTGATVVIGEDNVVFNPPDDPRVTAVGRILRQTSMDELPQLLNVLVGNMTLVGPRPDVPIALSMYTRYQRRKLDVSPGITGLAQVSGRNLLSRMERWDLDARYAETASLALDLKILAKTILTVVQREGIYKNQG